MVYFPKKKGKRSNRGKRRNLRRKKVVSKTRRTTRAFTKAVQSVINLYYEMSLSCETAEDSQAWLNVMESIKTWCSETYYSPSLEDEYEEEW